MRRTAAAVFGMWILLLGWGHAQTNSWKGGDGDWEDQSNWSLHRPASDQTILITNAGTFSVTISDQTAASFPATLTVLNLSVTNDAGQTTLLVTNRPAATAPLMLTVLEDMALNGGALLRLGDASIGATGVALRARNLSSDIALAVETNAALLISNQLAVGTAPARCGTLTTAGGTVTARSMSFGSASGSVGTWTMLAGTSYVGENMTIGSGEGTGCVEHVDGKLVMGGSTSDYAVSIGASALTTAMVTLVNGQLILTNSPALAVGEYGIGGLTVSNGCFIGRMIDFGVHPSASGVWHVTGGTNIVSAGSVRIGVGSGATGTVWVTGGNVDASNLNIEVGGSYGTGALIISNGFVTTRNLSVGCQSQSANGTLTVAGGKLQITGLSADCQIGGWGRGTMVQTGGEVEVTGSDANAGVIRLKDVVGGDGASARLTCLGGMLRAKEVQLEGETAGLPMWELSGGTSVVERTVSIGCVGPNEAIHINGGRLQTETLEVTADATSGGTLTVSAGELRVVKELRVAKAQNQSGTILVTGGECRVAPMGVPGLALVEIGERAEGQLRVTGGSFFSAIAFLGFGDGGIGTLTVSGGTTDIGYTIPWNGSSEDVLTAGYGPGSTGVVAVTGGILRAPRVTIGKKGLGTMAVAPGGNLDIFELRVADQTGGVATVTFEGGTMEGPSLRQIWELYIARGVNSTGSVFVTDGELAVGNGNSCYGAPRCTVGDHGRGLLSATNAVVMLNSLRIGVNGVVEFINSTLSTTALDCPVVNSNMMRFVNSGAVIAAPFQNTGTLTVDGGTLTFQGLVENGGSIIATNGFVRFLGGITNSGNIGLGPEQFAVTTVTCSNNDVIVQWQAVSGNEYRVQASTDLAGGYTNLAPRVIAVGSGLVLTNYVDRGALTNFPNRIYRVRQIWR